MSGASPDRRSSTDGAAGAARANGPASTAARVRDRFRGCLLGLAVGDALGAPAEFLTAGQVAERWGILTEMVGGGCHECQPGEVTDDTEMMLCLAESLVSRGDFDAEDIMHRYVAWFDTDPVDVGITVRTVMLGVKSGTTWERAARRAHEVLGRMTAGNGSLMRTAPVALRYVNEPRRRAAVALAESALTHFDQVAGWACVALDELIAAAIAGELREQLPVIAARLHEDEPRVAAVLTLAGEATREEIVASGYVLETLKAALWAVSSSDSFEDALIGAVNLGDDADTVGAVAGALAGALYGETAIPTRWATALLVRDRVLAAADGLTDLAFPTKRG
jgi:ADP-ribosyl-[dinitrogen reductase] hydrolase